MELTKESKRIKQPKNIKIELKNHQLASIHLMRKREKTNRIKINEDIEYQTRIGVLGDKVGSGKTHMMLGLIALKKKPKESGEILAMNSQVAIVIKKNWKLLDTSVILVPHTLINQWAESINETDLTIKTVTTRKDIKEIEETLKNKFIGEFPDILLVSSTFYKGFQILLEDMHWRVLRYIIDETDTIKLAANRRLLADFTWFITATYKNLLYVGNNGYIREILTSSVYDNFYNISQTMSGVIEKTVIKCDDKFILESFGVPEMNRIIHQCYTPVSISIIKNHVSPEIMNMINAGNSNGVMQSLNCQMKSFDGLVKMVTESHCKKLHAINHRIQYLNGMIATYPGAASHYNNQRNTAKKEKDEIESTIKHLKEKIKEDTCPICYDDELVCPCLSPCCKSKFCMHCLLTALSVTQVCPFCRGKISPSSIIMIGDDAPKETKEVKRLPKKDEMLIEIIKKNPNGKYLLFSDYYETFDKINMYFNDNNIKYKEIKGHGTSIAKTIKGFENGKIKVIMINSKNNAAGLNLQMATDIVLYHKMASDIEKQVIGRGQRPGRTCALNVHHLCYEHEKMN
jgi:hypothetical protein